MRVKKKTYSGDVHSRNLQVVLDNSHEISRQSLHEVRDVHLGCDGCTRVKHFGERAESLKMNE